MSRRVAYLAAIAYTALIAVPASADPECFENCRMPDVIDVLPPPPEVAEAVAPIKVAQPQEKAIEVKQAVSDVPKSKPSEPRTQVAAARPARVQPRMVVDPAPQRMERPEPRYEADAAPGATAKVAARIAAKTAAKIEAKAALAPASRPAVEPAEPVRSIESEAATPRPRPTQLASASRRDEETVRIASNDAVATNPLPPSTNGNSGVVVVAPNVYASGGSVAIYAGVTPDPAWTPCQIEQGGRAYHPCGPYSYHAYGAGGYRPLGNYQPYVATAAQVAVPNARIIRIEAEN